jgi:predicted transcriptional regulator
MARRFRSQIIATILLVAQGGSISTAIQQKANLTTDQFDAYIGHLATQGLISILSDSTGRYRSYRTTPKGVAYLSMMNSIHEVHLATK